MQSPGAEPRHEFHMLEFQGIEPPAQLGPVRGHLADRQQDGREIARARDRMGDRRVDLQQGGIGLRIDGP